MPFGWAWLPYDAHDLNRQAPVQTADRLQFPRELNLKSSSISFEQLPEPHYKLPNAVLAYGETVVKADLIEIYPDGKPGAKPGSGFAHGHVQITDPVGTLSADDASFNWIEKTGTASNAHIAFEGIELDADRVQVEPGAWTLDGIRGSFARGRPIGYIFAAHAVLRPGADFRAYSVDSHLFGTRLGGVHNIHYDPSGRLGGDLYPVPTLSGDRGFGLRYRPRYLIDDRTAIAASAAVTQTAPPSYGMVFARSFLPAGEAQGLVVPRSDLDMRFDFGYFDSVGIESPTMEHQQISRQRDNFSVDTAYNVEAFDRKGDEVFAKPFESTFERSFGMRGGFAVLSDSTFQQIHSLGGSDHDRFLNATTVALPVIRLAPDFTLRSRVDGAAFLGSSAAFSWIHAQLGLIYRPDERWRFGGAYVAGKQFGSALYEADELYSLNSLDLRSDYLFGPHRLSLLAKYDLDRGRWYDREVLVGQGIGPLEVFVRYRTFPSQFIIGGQLRIDSVLNELFKRNPGRPTSPPKLVD